MEDRNARRPLWADGDVLSDGWAYVHPKDRLTSPEYVALRAVYNQTCHRVGGSRKRLISVAEQANLSPPLTRQELRLGTRRQEIIEKLGVSAVELLAEHDQVVSSNLDAMSRLRDENNRIAVVMTVTN